MWRRIGERTKLLNLVYQQWLADDCPSLSAATAYYLGLGFFPMLLVVISALGIFMRFTELGNDAQERVLSAIADQVSPSLQQQAALALSHVQKASPISGPVGAAGVLLAALGGFVQFEQAFDRVWRVPVRESLGFWGSIKLFFRAKLVAFLGILLLACFALLVLLASTTLQFVRRYSETVVVLPGATWTLVQLLLTIAANVLAFTLLYRWLPKAKVAWRHALAGACLSAAAWEIGRQLLATVLVANKYSIAYGLIGSFIAILVWCYYAVAVLLFGAEYVRIISGEEYAPSQLPT